VSDLLPGAGQALRDQLQASLGTAYVLERELGGGGMSRVFVAEEARLRRKLVVKLLLPELAAGVSAERVQREIELTRTLGASRPTTRPRRRRGLVSNRASALICGRTSSGYSVTTAAATR
jgi:serine/threonine protein kinase